VRQFAQVDAAWFAASFPRLQIWLERLAGTPLFNAVMVKRPAWVAGNTAAAP